MVGRSPQLDPRRRHAHRAAHGGRLGLGHALLPERVRVRRADVPPLQRQRLRAARLRRRDPRAMSSLQYRCDTATSDEVHAHLTRCDADFTPPLSARLDLGDYAAKLAERAERFEAWDGGELVGLVAAYVTPGAPEAFISNVSVVSELRGQGVAAALVSGCIDSARGSGATTIKLEVATADRAAGRFYEKLGFTDRDPQPSVRPTTTTLTLDL